MAPIQAVNVPSGEILIALARAFDISLDYLAQMAALNAPQVAIADLDLVQKVQLVDKLGDEERQLVKNVMDLVVMKGRVRALADQGQVAKRAEPETAAAAPGAS